MNGSFWANVYYICARFMFIIPSVVLMYPITRRIAAVPFNRKHFILCLLLMIVNLFTNRYLSVVASGMNILSSLFFFFILYVFLYQKRNWALVLCLVKTTALLTVSEAVCMIVFMMMISLGFDQNKLMVFSLGDLTKADNMFYFGLVNFLSLLPILLVQIFWKHIRTRWLQLPDAVRKRYWLYTRSITRLVLLIITALGMLALPYTLFGEESLMKFLFENKTNYIILTVCSAILMSVALSYMLQDIRYIIQLQRLNTLEQQQAISNSLLQNLRFFRHNMVNMLYGLEGVLINGDKETVIDYYQQMREKCALVNNENVVALERITNPSVSGLLLHVVDHARQLNLPINLYVQEKVLFPHSLKDTDLCQVLGVLLDNAIEAADKAEERHVTVELRNVDDSLEIIVKNTYAGEISPEKLTMGGASTKEGHEGQGLRSCYHILSRRRGAFLNFWVTGQYVQAQLLLSR